MALPTRPFVPWNRKSSEPLEDSRKSSEPLEDSASSEPLEDSNPRACLGGEDPLVCYGKRIPQGGAVRGLLGIFGGVAEAMDLGRVCQKYAYAKASGTVEIYTGIPINGLNPLSLEVIKVEGRLLLGRKVEILKSKLYSDFI